MVFSILKNNVKCILIVLLLISLYFNVTFYLKNTRQVTSFELLSPSISELEREAFLDQQTRYTTQFFPLRNQFNQTLQNQKGEYGVYFESLNTGAWIGLHEKQAFVPASLLKIPLVASVLKKIQNQELTLDTLATVETADLNTLYGAIGRIKSGDQFTIRELINYTLYYSDNTAANVLRHFVQTNELLDTFLNLGLPLGSLKNSETIQISTRDYGNILRSLYYSSYLRRTYSQLILSDLIQTDFMNGIPAGLPPHIKTAHKIGYFIAQYGEQRHDCGIVYHPKYPYILCIMTEGLTQQEADRLTAQLSKQAYDFVSSD
ncbi:MAG TPA: serine hydrolase [Candidatus Nanoarchaeia archaeon]|nr:serine hydrolase [Candidatus Nanoarchaeia archaeon]